MQQAFELIQKVNMTMNNFGSYYWLFAVAFLVLIFMNHKVERPVWIFSLSIGVLVFNPFVVMVLIEQIPEFSNYWELLWILPQTLVMAMAGTQVFAYCKKKSDYIMMLIILFCIIATCGTLPFGYSEAVVSEQYVVKIPVEEEELLDMICEKAAEKEIVLAGPNAVVQHARAYSGDIALLYGKDMWMTQANRNVRDSYSEEIRELYNLLQQEKPDLELLAACVKSFGGNTIVLRQEIANDTIMEGQSFKKIATTDSYVVYSL